MTLSDLGWSLLAALGGGATVLVLAVLADWVRW